MFGDFKIGNCISFNGEYYKIIDISTYNNRTCYEIVSLKNNNKRIELKYYPIEPINLEDLPEIMGNDFDSMPDEVVQMFLNEEYDGVKLSYIHELQNAYKQATGKELV